MSIPLSPKHLSRYKDLALLFMHYGTDELISIPLLSDQFSDEEKVAGQGKPELFARDLEKLGPTFVKVGQLLSTRADLLPPPYLKALERLQDDVKSIPLQEIEAIVGDELGVRISKAFESFDETPLASASIGQVHRATLRDGREVAVKVQRPGIRKRILTDLESLAAIAGFVDEHSDLGRRYEFARIVKELHENLLKELDYGREAAHLHEFNKTLAQFPNISVPQPISDYCTSKVLTMELVDGQPITRISGVVHTEVDGSALADELFHAYLYQILVTGSFHADPHPGNLLITREHQLSLLDLGMVGHVPEDMREQLAHFLISVSERNGTAAAEIAIEMSDLREDFNRNAFVAQISDIVMAFGASKVSDIQVGSLVMDVTKVCSDHGLRLPPAVIMLGKTLLNLDRVAQELDPNYDPNVAIREKAGQLLKDQLRSQFNLSEVLLTLRDVRTLALDLPGKINRFSSRLAENKIKLQVEAVDEKLLLEGFQKIANRISAGIILAAIIIGAALMMRVEAQFMLWGYPGIAILFFLAAAMGGAVLVKNVLFDDK